MPRFSHGGELGLVAKSRMFLKEQRKEGDSRVQKGVWKNSLKM